MPYIPGLVVVARALSVVVACTRPPNQQQTGAPYAHTKGHFNKVNSARINVKVVCCDVLKIWLRHLTSINLAEVTREGGEIASELLKTNNDCKHCE